MSGQVVVEAAECRDLKSLLQEKEALITELQNNFDQTSKENTQLTDDLQEKTKAIDLLFSENQSLKSQLEDVLTKLKAAKAENKILIDRWMLEKMKDAEKLNEGVKDAAENPRGAASPFSFVISLFLRLFSFSNLSIFDFSLCIDLLNIIALSFSPSIQSVSFFEPVVTLVVFSLGLVSVRTLMHTNFVGQEACVGGFPVEPALVVVRWSQRGGASNHSDFLSGNDFPSLRSFCKNVCKRAALKKLDNS